MMSFIQEKEGSKKGSILMLHGNSSSSNVYKPTIESDIDHNMLAMDLLGHGNSERTGSYLISDYKDQILSTINEIDDDLLLVGNSIGGHLAIEVANQTPRLKGILIFGTPPVKIPFNYEEAWTHVDESSAYTDPNPPKETLDKMIDLGCANKNVIPTLKDDFLRTDKEVRSTLAKQVAESTAFSDEYDIWMKLSCKKFMMNGDQDPIMNASYLKSVCAKSNSEFITIKDCGHYPSIEQPAEFITHLKRISEVVFA